MLETKDTGSSVLKKKVLKNFFQAISKKKVFKNFFQAISKRGEQKRSSQIFREVSGVFQQNFNGSKNSAVLEPRRGQLSRTWGFEAKAKDMTFEATAKDFKMCPRGQGRPRGLHLCSYCTKVFLKYVSLPNRSRFWTPEAVTVHLIPRPREQLKFK